jgi:hypothetical protein
MSTRKDVHAPRNLRTEDYEFFACGSYGSALEAAYNPLASPRGREMLDAGWKFASVEGACQHCGKSRLTFYALLLHIPSRTFLRVGEQCLDNRFARATAEFQRLRTQRRLNAEEQTRQERIAQFDSAHPGYREFLARKSEEAAGSSFGEFVTSLRDQLHRTGVLSEKQLASVERMIAKDAERAAQLAEVPEAPDVPEGKHNITGEIVKIATQESAYGAREVMTVRDDRGFRVWGTQPRALFSAQEGDRVTFTATLSPSERDSTFGFFKRPTKPAKL